MQKLNFSYDKENDDLFLFSPKSKSKGSVELGDLILDYNNKKELVGIQIMNASSMIKDLVGEDLQTVKGVLSDLKECKIDVKTKGNWIFIKIYLLSNLKEISPVISVPKIVEPSPALTSY